MSQKAYLCLLRFQKLKSAEYHIFQSYCYASSLEEAAGIALKEAQESLLKEHPDLALIQEPNITLVPPEICPANSDADVSTNSLTIAFKTAVVAENAKLRADMLAIAKKYGLDSVKHAIASIAFNATSS